MSVDEFYSRRKKEREERLTAASGFYDEYAAAEFPLLHSFLTAGEVLGNKRKLGKLVLFCEDGRLKVCLKDADNDSVLFVTLEGYVDAFSCLDAALADPGADWRQSKRWGRN